MIAQFSDLQSLTYAFDELLRSGVPEQRISPDFEEVEAEAQLETEHQNFLKQLHGCMVLSPSSNSNEGREGRSLRDFRFQEHGGTLNLKCPQLETKIMQIILRHHGLLVG